MSVLLSPTPSIIEEEKARDHRIHNWISELRAHSPVDAFSPPSIPATPDLDPNPTATTYNNEPQWQYSATRRSTHAPGPADGYIGARDMRIPSNGATNRDVRGAPGPMPAAYLGQYALAGNVAMPMSAPPAGQIPALANSGAPMTLSHSTQRPAPVFATHPGPSSFPNYIPPQIQFAPFPAPMPPPITETHRSRRSRSHSRSHHPPRHTIVVPEAISQLIHPSHRSRGRSRTRSPSPVRLPRDYVPVSAGPTPSSTRTRDRRSSRARTRSPPPDRSRGSAPIARDYATYPVVASSSQPHHANNDVSPRHHRHSRDGHHHHHHHHDTSRQRVLSQSYPYANAPPVSSRPVYSRQRSHSVDAYDPRMSRARPGGAYPTQTQTGYADQTQPTGYGHGQGGGGSSDSATTSGSPSGSPGGTGYGRSYQSQKMQPQATSTYPSSQQQPTNQMPVPHTMGGYYPNQSSASAAAPPIETQPQMSMYSSTQQPANHMPMGANTAGGYYGAQPSSAAPLTASMQPQMNATVLVPVSDGRGGWTYTQQAQATQGTNQAFGQPTTSTNVMSRGRQSTPGFFSRVFGRGGRSKSAAPQIVYPIHASTRHHHAVKPVQYTHPRPRHLHRRSSR